jgi:hypothetical protein
LIIKQEENNANSSIIFTTRNFNGNGKSIRIHVTLRTNRYSQVDLKTMKVPPGKTYCLEVKKKKILLILFFNES